MNTLTKTESPSAVEYRVPVANILEAAEGYSVELELPGVAKEGLQITVKNNELRVLGHLAESERKGQELYRESRGLDYRRTFELDPTIDTSRISAQLEQGILKLHLPKAENVQPRKIEVA